MSAALAARPDHVAVGLEGRPAVARDLGHLRQEALQGHARLQGRLAEAAGVEVGPRSQHQLLARQHGLAAAQQRGEALLGRLHRAPHAPALPRQLPGLGEAPVGHRVARAVADPHHQRRARPRRRARWGPPSPCGRSGSRGSAPRARRRPRRPRPRCRRAARSATRRPRASSPKAAGRLIVARAVGRARARASVTSRPLRPERNRRCGAPSVRQDEHVLRLGVRLGRARGSDHPRAPAGTRTRTGRSRTGLGSYSPLCASDARLGFFTGIAYFDGFVGTTGLSILRS